MTSPDHVIKLSRTKRRVDADDADLSGSAFRNVKLSGSVFHDVNLADATFEDVNLSGVQIRNANLTGVSIVDALTSGMTINGIAVADLLAAYRAIHRTTE